MVEEEIGDNRKLTLFCIFGGERTVREVNMCMMFSPFKKVYCLNVTPFLFFLFLFSF